MNAPNGPGGIGQSKGLRINLGGSIKSIRSPADEYPRFLMLCKGQLNSESFLPKCQQKNARISALPSYKLKSTGAEILVLNFLSAF